MTQSRPFSTAGKSQDKEPKRHKKFYILYVLK